MSAQDFNDAIEAPDLNSAHEQLSRIVADGVSGDAGIPDSALAYLRTFCDGHSSVARRRWVGLALCKMLQSSSEVVTRLKRSSPGLTGVGNVVLTTGELEETKIVAGLIIREGLARGIKFLSFWPNDKVQNSASNFPQDAGPTWMSEFQDFMETLSSLRITERVNDCDLFYVASLVASDGYKWKDPNDTASLLLMQRGHLCVMTADPVLQNFHFVDIPLSHILSTRLEKTVLHDSQGRAPAMTPWDVVIKLRVGSWTYRINSAERSGEELSLTFISEDEAKECQCAISDLLRSTTRLPGNVIIPDPLQAPAAQGGSAEKSPISQTATATQRQPGTVKAGTLPSVKKSMLSNKGHSSVQKRQGPKPGAVAPPSSLPRISKLNKVQSAKAQHVESDVFAIPQNDDASKTRVKRKRSKSVVYKDLETSEEESSASEYTENKKKRIGAPIKQNNATKAPRSKKGAGWSTRNGRKSSTTGPSGTGSQPINPAKSPLLSQLIRKSQPSASAQVSKSSARPKAGPDGKENVPTSGRYSVSPAKPTTTDLGSEIDILNKLDRSESSAEFGVDASQSFDFNEAMSPEKSRVHSSHPATPPRKRRVVTGHAPMDLDAESRDTVSNRPPSSHAPLRVLADPTSPCIKQDRRPSTPVTSFERSMKAPAKPTAEQSHPTSNPRRRPMCDSRRRQDVRHTPMHQLGKRTHSGGSASIELLSSNSKPTPASPHAESTAISGHADPDRVDMEREMGKNKIMKNDPFTKQSNANKLSSFTRRLTGDDEPAPDGDNHLAGASMEVPIEIDDVGSSSDISSEDELADQPPKKCRTLDLVHDTQSFTAESPVVRPAKRSYSRSAEPQEQMAQKKARLASGVMVDDAVPSDPLQPVVETEVDQTAFRDAELEMDGDTLIEHENEVLPNPKVSPLLFRSSPPPLHDSPSSHSSTSAEDEPRTDPHIPTSEADNMEWEASLKPHQRSLHDQLLRVSTRVVRHVVDNETAIHGIADTYARDGKHLVETLVDRHNDEFAAVFKDVQKKKEEITKSSGLLLQRLEKEQQTLDE